MKTNLAKKLSLTALILAGCVLVPSAVQPADRPASDPAAAALAALGLSPDADPAAGDLASVRARAAIGSPSVDAALRRWEAARAAESGAGAPPDPRIGIGYMLEPVETKAGPQRLALGLSQRLPWFGTLGLRRDQASGRTAVAAARVRAAALRAAAAAAEQWWEIVWLRRAAGITSEHLRIAGATEASLRADYAAGGDVHADLLGAQIEMARLEERLASLEDRRLARRAALAAVLGFGPGAGPDPTDPGGDLPENPDLGTLRRVARGRNPELAALNAAAASREAALELAAKRGWPELTFGIDWIIIDEPEIRIDEGGKDPVALRLGMTLPIWRGAVDAGRREAAAEFSASASRVTVAERGIEARLADLTARHRQARRRADLLDDALIPRGRQAVAASRAAYAVGAAGFGDLLESRRDLLEFELERARAEADLGIVRAALEEIVGGALPASTAGEGE